VREKEKIASRCYKKDFGYYVTPPVTLLDVLAFDCANDSTPNIPVNSETAVTFHTRSLRVSLQ